MGWWMVRVALICGLVDGDSSFNLCIGGWSKMTTDSCSENEILTVVGFWKG